METKATAAHKRRLSSGSESELTAGRKADKAGDVLSPKKPRLQKTSPKTPKKKKKKDRNPFRYGSGRRIGQCVDDRLTVQGMLIDLFIYSSLQKTGTS
jgi:hypothetical protein